MNKMVLSAVRILFLGYLSYVAVSNLQHIEKSSKYLSKQYKTFEDTLKSRFNVKLPAIMSHKNVDKHKTCIVQFSSYGVIIMSLLAIFVCSCFTAAVGLNYFLMAMITGNYVAFDYKNFNQYKDMAISLGVLGLSIMLSCNTTSDCCKVNNRPQRTTEESSKTTRTTSPRRKNLKRE